MSSLSKQAIVDRVRLFVDSVRNEREGFKPEKCWWLLNETKLSRKKYPDAISLLDQLCISVDDMREHFTAYWSSKIGDTQFGASLRRGVDEQCFFVTVKETDEAANASSPLDGASIIVRGSNTRNAPWKVLQETIELTFKQQSTSCATLRPTHIEPNAESEMIPHPSTLSTIKMRKPRGYLDPVHFPLPKNLFQEKVVFSEPPDGRGKYSMDIYRKNVVAAARNQFKTENNNLKRKVQKLETKVITL